MSKLKEIQRSATFAWSPNPQHSNLIATATSAGTISPGFSFDDSALEIFNLDVASSSSDMPVVGKVPITDRVQKLCWGKFEPSYPYGILAAGMANGLVNVYNPAKVIEGSGDALVSSAEKHKGPVFALDFNPLMHSLLASGAGGSEIFIWDLSNPSALTAYTPGQKSQQQSDITCVSWNKTVQHILASATYGGVSVIWDLKAKRPVLSFSDPKNRSPRTRALAWHPNETYQLITASEDDTSPVLQVWDLRNTYSPTKYLEGHKMGIWALSWCPFDCNYLLSCSRDHRTLCWYLPTGASVEVETAATNWNVDVQWSPVLPALLSTASLEGRIRVYSLADMSPKANTPSADGFGVQQPGSTVLHPPPRWFSRNAGAAFGFGGKLISFGRGHTVRLSTVSFAEDTSLGDRSTVLEEALRSQQYTAFCESKIAAAVDPHEREAWQMIRALIAADSSSVATGGPDARARLLHELGFDTTDTLKQIEEFIAALPEPIVEGAPVAAAAAAAVTAVPEPAGEVPEDNSAKAPEGEEQEETEAAPKEAEPEEAVAFTEKKEKDLSGLFGDSADPFAFGGGAAQSDFLAGAGASKAAAAAPTHAPTATETAEPTPARPPVEPIPIDTSGTNPDAVVSRALVIGNFEAAVDALLKLGRYADALIIAAAGGASLWQRATTVYFDRHRPARPSFFSFLQPVLRGDMAALVEGAVLDGDRWKAVIATVVSYARANEYHSLCSALAERLDAAGNLSAAATAFLCAANLDRAVDVWERLQASRRPAPRPHEALQEIIELVSVFSRAVAVPMSDAVAARYVAYATLLAGEGHLAQAQAHLHTVVSAGGAAASVAGVLLDRLFHSQPQQPGAHAPPFPFAREDVRGPLEQYSSTGAAAARPATGPAAGASAYSSGAAYGGQSQYGASSPYGAMSTPAGAALGGGRPAPITTPASSGAYYGAPSAGPVPPITTPAGTVSAAFSTHAPGGAVRTAATGVVPTIPLGGAGSSVGSRIEPPSVFTPGLPGAGGGAGGHSTFTPAFPGGGGSVSLLTPVTATPSPPTSVGIAPRPAPSSTGAPEPAPSSAPAKAPEPARPVGDGSGPQVAEALKGVLQHAAGITATDPKRSRMVADADKRLQPAFVKLTNNEHDAEITDHLKQICQALGSGDVAAAETYYKQLGATKWEVVGSASMLGLKRLIDAVKP